MCISWEERHLDTLTLDKYIDCDIDKNMDQNRRCMCVLSWKDIQKDRQRIIQTAIQTKPYIKVDDTYVCVFSLRERHVDNLTEKYIDCERTKTYIKIDDIYVCSVEKRDRQSVRQIEKYTWNYKDWRERKMDIL